MHLSVCECESEYDRKKTTRKTEDVQERERERLQPYSVSGSLEWHTAAETVSAPLRSMVSWLLLGREQSGNIVLQPYREMKSKIHSCGFLKKKNKKWVVIHCCLWPCVCWRRCFSYFQGFCNMTEQSFNKIQYLEKMCIQIFKQFCHLKQQFCSLWLLQSIKS